MEFLTPKQKKEKARRLYIGYGLLSVLIGLATYILISTALGYEIFSTKGDIVQNGLLFVDSSPGNANIYINGKKESSETGAKLSLPDGVYDISLRKSGYVEWRDKVTLSGGTVKFINYPKLMPLNPQVLADVPMALGSTMTLQTTDKRWLVVSLPEQNKLADIYDLDNPNSPPISLSVPEALLNGQKAKMLELKEWASDDRHLLARVLIGDKNSYLLFDKDNLSDVVDLTQTFGLVDADTVGFWDDKSDRVYIHHAASTVVLGNIKDKTISPTPLVAEPVRDIYVLPGERAIYTVSGSQGISFKLLSASKSYSFLNVKDSSEPFIVKSASFNRNEYITVGGGGLEKTSIYKNLESSIKKTSDTRSAAPFALLPSKSHTIDFSRRNRFILSTDGLSNVVYDIEAKEVIKYTTPAKSPAITGWFDDSRIYSLGSDKILEVYDFNGSNVVQLAASSSSIPYVNNDLHHTAYFVPSTSSQSIRFVDIEQATPLK
jgi:hypothetical protein